ncbi:MAG: hypothetical protein M3Y19_08570, partial [Actinomycetota bacterium]|nr:hypothetical protein [Actinomycetota bacterium]
FLVRWAYGQVMDPLKLLEVPAGVGQLMVDEDGGALLGREAILVGHGAPPRNMLVTIGAAQRAPNRALCSTEVCELW